MKKEDADKIIAISKNITNISVMLGELVMPFKALQTKYTCSTEEACNIKLRAEEYLRKYGCLTIDASLKAINKIVNESVETVA